VAVAVVVQEQERSLELLAAVAHMRNQPMSSLAPAAQLMWASLLVEPLQELLPPLLAAIHILTLRHYQMPPPKALHSLAGHKVVRHQIPPTVVRPAPVWARPYLAVALAAIPAACPVRMVLAVVVRPGLMGPVILDKMAMLEVLVALEITFMVVLVDLVLWVPTAATALNTKAAPHSDQAVAVREDRTVSWAVAVVPMGLARAVVHPTVLEVMVRLA
jgi:hypothetical protein